MRYVTIRISIIRLPKHSVIPLSNHCAIVTILLTHNLRLFFITYAVWLNPYLMILNHSP